MNTETKENKTVEQKIRELLEATNQKSIVFSKIMKSRLLITKEACEKTRKEVEDLMQLVGKIDQLLGMIPQECLTVELHSWNIGIRKDSSEIALFGPSEITEEYWYSSEIWEKMTKQEKAKTIINKWIFDGVHAKDYLDGQINYLSSNYEGLK